MNLKTERLVSLLILAGFALAAPMGLAQEKPKVVKDSMVSNQKKRTYYLYVPGGVKAPAPLIVLLHGSGRDGMSLIDKWKDLADKEGVIIVGPDSGGEGWSTPRDGPQFLHELVENLRSKYPINPRRIYLFGHSAGAVFALLMSTTESEYFAAAAVHAGAFRPPAELQNVGNATRKIPLAIWVGTVDPFFPLADVRATRDAFRAKGFTIEVTEMPGHDHWYYDLAPGINAGAWEFLKKYELANDPRYSEYAGLGSGGNANRLIAEINMLTARARELIQTANQKEAELDGKDWNKDRSQVARIAQEHMDILAESASLFRAAADKAEISDKSGLSSKQARYFGLIGQYNRKCAELLEVMRGRSEALLSTESFAAIEAKRDEAQRLADKLHLEIDDLQKTIDKLMH